MLSIFLSHICQEIYSVSIFNCIIRRSLTEFIPTFIMATLGQVLQQANHLLNNGHEDEAMRIYDNIVQQYPQLGVGWFYKAYCRQNSNPAVAAEYYAKAVIYDKNCAHHVSNNLHFIYNHNTPSEAVVRAILDACNTILKAFSELWEIRYLVAVIKGNSGDYLNSLSEYYIVINDPASSFSTDKDAFLEFGLDSDLQTCHAYMRSRTLSLPSDKDYVFEGPMFEYCYNLPIEPFFPFQKYVFDFGKYMGYTVTEVVMSNPHYIDWCIHNVPSFCVNEVVCYDIIQKGYGNNDTIMTNNAKLKYINKINPLFHFIDQSDYPDIDLTDINNITDLLNNENI